VPRDLEQTFLQLVRDNDRRLWKICRVYARDSEARKDLYQEMLVQLWRSLPSFAGESLPGTWLYRVALNTALANSRRTARRREAPLEEYDIASDAPAADEALDAAQRLDRLYAAIDGLNDFDKMLVTLYLDEKTYREMAAVLGLSETNVGVRLHRIKKELEGQFAREGA
jgi:RNA polymerase sigma-70 factor (ECF subfamily)